MLICGKFVCGLRVLDLERAKGIRLNHVVSGLLDCHFAMANVVLGNQEVLGMGGATVEGGHNCRTAFRI
jgi:hypothetical protein